jgi:hypothetical protein
MPPDWPARLDADTPTDLAKGLAVADRPIR